MLNLPEFHCMADIRIVPCSACGGDRGHEVWTGYDPRDGSPTGYWQECGHCGGTGDEEVEAEPVEHCPDCNAIVSGDGISIDERACFRCKGD